MKWMKILGYVSKGMEIAQKIGVGKSKEEKVQIAIDEASDLLGLAEEVANQDLLKDERLRPFIDKYVEAGKNLVNKIHELGLDAKDLKV